MPAGHGAAPTEALQQNEVLGTADRALCTIESSPAAYADPAARRRCH
jgi:hypothetical protein